MLGHQLYPISISTATGSARSITVVVSRCRVGEMAVKKREVAPRHYHRNLIMPARFWISIASSALQRIGSIRSHALVGGLITKQCSQDR
jgi:hypothetical protein